MKSLPTLSAWLLLMTVAALAQANPDSAQAHKSTAKTPAPVAPAIPLNSFSTMNVLSEMGGAFMNPAKCDEDGNLYIRKFATDRPLRSPTVKINPDGKRTALFDPAAFSQLNLDRADAFSFAYDGGLYQIAQKGVVKPRIYVLHFSSDGSPLSSVLLDADLEVYAFAAFLSGNFLVSGMQRDVTNPKDPGRNFTAVFSTDGRMLAELSFEHSQNASKQAQGTAKTPAKSANNAAEHQAVERQNDVPNSVEQAAPTLDLSDAEVGVDGNLYVMRSSSPALVYVIAPGGKIQRTLKIPAPVPGLMPSAFHVSGNQLAVSFRNDKNQSQMLAVADAQTGRKISTYSDSTGMASSFACYSANDGVFTFLKLGEGNALEVIRAEAR